MDPGVPHTVYDNVKANGIESLIVSSTSVSVNRKKKKGGSLFYLCSHPKIFETGCGSGFSPRSTKSVQYKVNLGDTSEAKPN